MPRFSAFTPFGLLRFRRARSAAEDAYEAFVSGAAGAFSSAKGTPGDAEAYATAMAIGRVRAALERSAMQHDEAHVTDMLPEVERNYRVVPPETETIRERRRTLVARKRVLRGPSQPNVEAALAELLGSGFVGLRFTKMTEATTLPASPGSGPGLFTRPNTPSKLFRLTTNVVVLGVPVTFGYAPEFDALARLEHGEPAIASPEDASTAERVTVYPSVETDLRASAVFTKPHAAGSCIRTGTYPLWTSTKRHWFVMLTRAALASIETRRKANALLRRLLRGTSTWSLVALSSPTTLGPFTIGVSGLGTTPLGTLTVP